MSDMAVALSDDEIRQAWIDVYRDEQFVAVLEPGVMPATANVVGSNAAHIQVAVDRRANRILAITAIDNLNRGTAGQAVQSLNIALGLPEDAGLTKIGVAP
jgi:N-acetyl-gamma-glutamyl-phosphate reductase